MRKKPIIIMLVMFLLVSSTVSAGILDTLKDWFKIGVSEEAPILEDIGGVDYYIYSDGRMNQVFTDPGRRASIPSGKCCLYQVKRYNEWVWDCSCYVGHYCDSTANLFTKADCYAARDAKNKGEEPPKPPTPPTDEAFCEETTNGVFYGDDKGNTYAKIDNCDGNLATTYYCSGLNPRSEGVNCGAKGCLKNPVRCGEGEKCEIPSCPASAFTCSLLIAKDECTPSDVSQCNRNFVECHVPSAQRCDTNPNNVVLTYQDGSQETFWHKCEDSTYFYPYCKNGKVETKDEFATGTCEFGCDPVVVGCAAPPGNGLKEDGERVSDRSECKSNYVVSVTTIGSFPVISQQKYCASKDPCADYSRNCEPSICSNKDGGNKGYTGTHVVRQTTAPIAWNKCACFFLSPDKCEGGCIEGTCREHLSDLQIEYVKILNKKTVYDSGEPVEVELKLTNKGTGKYVSGNRPIYVQISLHKIKEGRASFIGVHASHPEEEPFVEAQLLVQDIESHKSVWTHFGISNPVSILRTPSTTAKWFDGTDNSAPGEFEVRACLYKEAFGPCKNYAGKTVEAVVTGSPIRVTDSDTPCKEFNWISCGGPKCEWQVAPPLCKEKEGPPTPVKCGDGVIGSGEECEDDNLGGKTCKKDYNYEGGTLSCSNCKIDTSGCTGKSTTCGDGKKDANEECDGEDFGDLICESQGEYVGGELSCTGECKIDTKACIAKGDENVAEASVKMSELNKVDMVTMQKAVCGYQKWHRLGSVLKSCPGDSVCLGLDYLIKEKGLTKARADNLKGRVHIVEIGVDLEDLAICVEEPPKFSYFGWIEENVVEDPTWAKILGIGVPILLIFIFFAPRPGGRF